MRGAAYLSKSPDGVYYARFVVPVQQLTPGASREFRQHGARMTAMDKASENANELLKGLKIS